MVPQRLLPDTERTPMYTPRFVHVLLASLITLLAGCGAPAVTTSPAQPTTSTVVATRPGTPVNSTATTPVIDSQKPVGIIAIGHSAMRPKPNIRDTRGKVAMYSVTPLRVCRDRSAYSYPVQTNRTGSHGYRSAGSMHGSLRLAAHQATADPSRRVESSTY